MSKSKPLNFGNYVYFENLVFIEALLYQLLQGVFGERLDRDVVSGELGKRRTPELVVRDRNLSKTVATGDIW